MRIPLSATLLLEVYRLVRRKRLKLPVRILTRIRRIRKTPVRIMLKFRARGTRIPVGYMVAQWNRVMMIIPRVRGSPIRVIVKAVPPSVALVSYNRRRLNWWLRLCYRRAGLTSKNSVNVGSP